MIAVMFELQPKNEQKDRYFELAGALRAELEQIEGFVSVERFKSLTNDNKYLSLSFFENEQAIALWRKHLCHQAAQKEGRAQIFDHYRLRVASVIRDYSMVDRADAP